MSLRPYIPLLILIMMLNVAIYVQAQYPYYNPSYIIPPPAEYIYLNVTGYPGPYYLSHATIYSFYNNFIAKGLVFLNEGGWYGCFSNVVNGSGFLNLNASCSPQGNYSAVGNPLYVYASSYSRWLWVQSIDIHFNRYCASSTAYPSISINYGFNNSYINGLMLNVYIYAPGQYTMINLTITTLDGALVYQKRYLLL